MVAFGCFGLMQQTFSAEEDNNNTAQCLFGSDKKAKAVEDKFATYWPRNIMILFGPPGGWVRESVEALPCDVSSCRLLIR